MNATLNSAVSYRAASTLQTHGSEKADAAGEPGGLVPVHRRAVIQIATVSGVSAFGAISRRALPGASCFSPTALVRRVFCRRYAMSRLLQGRKSPRFRQ
jgi:hypothetical protein